MSDSDVVIRVEGLGKKYALHHEKAERYTALRDVLARQAKAAGRLLNPFTLAGQLHKAQREAAAEKAESEEEFWALKDVNFEIRRGERVGIIGRNGAGKSTLLKILSRITEPTTGRVEIRGRVASLLEVGTGFHPELTGRENIYLNGAILGMTRREIRSKFDEIVDFAEVEKFLDTPVKRYSSGMYVRLAFAVAAHLDPEILVVDEVLAVGDKRFQDKCLQRMSLVSGSGATLLFVSHNSSAIASLCSQAILLRDGQMRLKSTPQKCIREYSLLSSFAMNVYAANDAKPCNLPAIVASAKITEECRTGGDNGLLIIVRILLREFVDNLHLGIQLINTAEGICFTDLIRLDDAIVNGPVFLPVEVTYQASAAFLTHEHSLYSLNLSLQVPNSHYIQNLKDCLIYDCEHFVTDKPTHVSLPGIMKPPLYTLKLSNSESLI
jgi:ABC-type polysaccharide/polyol phosphate transport system ATPase subunit